MVSANDIERHSIIKNGVGSYEHTEFAKKYRIQVA